MVLIVIIGRNLRSISFIVNDNCDHSTSKTDKMAAQRRVGWYTSTQKQPKNQNPKTLRNKHQNIVVNAVDQNMSHMTRLEPQQFRNGHLAQPLWPLKQQSLTSALDLSGKVHLRITWMSTYTGHKLSASSLDNTYRKVTICPFSWNS